MRPSFRHGFFLATFLLLCALLPGPLPAQAIAPEDLRIVVEGSRIEFNGVPIELPIGIKKIEQIIGEKPRVPFYGGVWVWDNYGFVFSAYRYGTEEEYKTKGNTLSIFIRKKQTRDEKYETSIPQHNFRGTLIIDGVRITPELTMPEFNARKRGRPFHQRPQKWKFTSHARIEGRAKPASMQFYANVHDDLTIRYISIWYEEYEPLTEEERREIENLDRWGMPKPKITPLTEEEKRFLMEVAPVARYLMIQDGMDRLTAFTYLMELMAGRALLDMMSPERRALAERYIEAAEREIRKDAGIVERANEHLDEELDGLDAFLREQRRKRAEEGTLLE